MRKQSNLTPLAASDTLAPEPQAPSTIAFLCPGCSNRLTVPISLAGVTGPCPHCATTIQSPSLPVSQAPAHLDPITEPVSPLSRGIEPRGGSRPPQINLRSVSSIDWASDDAREASRRVRPNASVAERMDHRIEKVTRSDRFENARAIFSVAAVAIMAGTIFWMAKTGWGNPESPTSESTAGAATPTASQYVSAPVAQEQKTEVYPWREPLPEVVRDKDDPFYRE